MNFSFNELRQQRRGLTLTYSLTALENIFGLLYPFAIGVAINGLIAGERWQLLPLVVVWLIHVGTSYWRQRFDTRLFTRIYAAVAARMASHQRDTGASRSTTTSEIAARTDMVEELVEFMEEEVPAGVLAVFALVGGVAMLAWYDLIAGALMSLILPPTFFIYWRFGCKAKRLEKQFNDQSEGEVDVIAEGSEEALTEHFQSLSRYRVAVSDAEANTWSVVELLGLLVFAAVLIRLTTVPGLAVGDIVAAVAYAIRVIEGLDALPNVISGLSRMLDSVERMKDE